MGTGISQFVILLIYDRMTSNEIEISLSSIETYFSAWTINTNSSYSDIWSEDAGITFNAAFTVRNSSDRTAVEDALSYQW